MLAIVLLFPGCPWSISSMVHLLQFVYEQIQACNSRNIPTEIALNKLHTV